MQGFPPPLSALGMTAVDSSPRLGSPTGLIYGAGRAASRIWAWQPTRCWPVCLLSVISRIFTITSASRLQSQSASRESCSCCIRSISNRWNIIRHLSLISIWENEERVKTQTGPKINIQQASWNSRASSHRMHFCFEKHEMRAMEGEKYSRSLLRSMKVPRTTNSRQAFEAASYYNDIQLNRRSF